MKFLRIEYPGIAWQTASIMLHVIGAVAVLGWLAGMPYWTWPFSLLAIIICFYSGYYFNLGFRQRRFAEFRYAGERAPKKAFDETLWRERRDAHKENRNCKWCHKIFNPENSQQEFCSIECWTDNENDKQKETVGSA